MIHELRLKIYLYKLLKGLQWSGMDLLCPRLSEWALILVSRPFVEEVDEGADVEEADVEEAHLRGAGVGGIIAFFLVFLSNTVEKTNNT